ncbi:DUF2723 domain-containing protein [Sungkyunkwania multivorans]|uniref:DUF2723 domain-containing protein n=1 Tax=Sungkyunkwania multivorans TaxID=1173618 RepID=A0ABW3CTH5_9FLAO
MTFFNFKKLNTILGWTVFTIALITYGLTVEPTASFWDCAEYIATSAKLQVGHPPGAPLFQMMGAFFAMFASEPDQIALMVNYMSVFSSAFTILFMFWSITILVRKFVVKDEEADSAQNIAIFGSGLVGSLAYMFSDSFWFNAVEAEVYAMATFIMALMFWLALRWEQDMHKPRGNRWLILIAFLIGLSFGVHFMGLLTIPAIGMIYFFKNYEKVTVKNFILANVVSVAVLLFIFKLLLPSTLKFFGYLEVFFVNSIGLPFNSGTIIAGIAIIAAFYFLLRYTRKKQYVQLNTITLCVLFVLIGFSSWVMIPIRANANTVINENAPSDARLLLAYYNLEQYPETHLFYGPMFTDMYSGQDEEEPYIDDKPKYERNYETGKYQIVNKWEKARINSNRKHKGILPRMWSPEHAANYMKIIGPLDFKMVPQSKYIGIREDQYGELNEEQLNYFYREYEYLKSQARQFKADYANGEADEEDYHKFLQKNWRHLDIERPTLWNNLQYLFQYQMSYMYWRYFMWNFVGRQNDVQGNNDVVNGNWISGIKLIDEWKLGNQDYLPSDSLNNKARNTYFFLPLILGVIGFVFAFKENMKWSWVLLVLFLFTGLALKVYLNERPFEPRERDYALVGSFYVFAIWIGLGVYGLYDEFKRFLSPKILAPTVTVVCLLAVPVLMGFQNWDDHDRSNRYTAQSMAKAYLDSCQENAIIYTIGDNDTFALWYAQDIEEYRQDVRTINTSLLATDWYIDQTKRKTYDSPPVKSQLQHYQYAWGVNDYIVHEPVEPFSEQRWNIKDFMNWIASDNPGNRRRALLQRMQGDNISLYSESALDMIYYPTNKIRIPVNKENVLKYGIVAQKDADKIVDYIDIDLPTSGLAKNRIMMLDILANNEWKRPIYFTGGSYSPEEYIWLKDYLQLDGLTYKLVPIKTPVDRNNPYEMGRIDTDTMYDIVMEWDWGNSGSPDIYHDPETRKNSISYRGNLARLAEKLIAEGKDEKAKKIADLAMEKMPVKYFGYYSLVDPYIGFYYHLGEEDRARDIYKEVAQKYKEQLRYYESLKRSNKYTVGEDIITNIERYRNLLETPMRYKDTQLVESELDTFIELTKPFMELYGSYDYYTLLDRSINAYYEAGNADKARKLFADVSGEYQKRLAELNNLDPQLKMQLSKRIVEEVESYRTLIDILMRNNDTAILEVEAKKFNSYIEPFMKLYAEQPDMDSLPSNIE